MSRKGPKKGKRLNPSPTPGEGFLGMELLVMPSKMARQKERRRRSFLLDTKERARQIKWDTLALYLAFRDPRVPLKAKVIIGVTVAYALSPIDLIPDFIPVLGYLDDLVLVPLGIRYAVKAVPKEVMEECRRRARVEFRKGSPKSWKAAIVVVLIWLGLLVLFAFLMLKLIL